MAIQMRRGLKKDFDPSKMLAGEWAVSIDPETENQVVWMCFAPNVVKRIGTYEDLKEYIESAEEVEEAHTDADGTEYESLKERLDTESRLSESFTDTSESPLQNSASGNIRAIKLVGNSHKSANLINKTSASGTRYETIILSKPLPIGTYTFSANVTSNDTDATTCRVYFGFDSALNTGQAVQIERNGRKSITVTTTSEVVAIAVYAGSTYANSASDTFSFTDIMLNDGATALPYEPYGLIIPSGEIKTKSKNFFNANEWELDKTAGDEILIVDKNELKCSNNLSLLRTWVFKIPAYLKGKYLTISTDMYSSNPDAVARIQVLNTGIIKTQTSNSKPGKMTISFLYEDIETLSVSFTGGPNNTSTIIFKNIQIEEGDTATEYAPFDESKINTDFPLYSVGDVRNKLTIYPDGSGKAEQNLDIFDMGEMNWSYGASEGRFSSPSLINYIKKEYSEKIILCEGYDSNQAPIVMKPLIDKTICAFGNGRIYLVDFDYTSGIELKNALKGKKLIYELATPITTDLTASEVAELLSLKTFDGQTYIDTDGAEFEVSYFANTKIGEAVASVDSKVDWLLEVVADAEEKGYIANNRNLWNEQWLNGIYNTSDGSYSSNSGAICSKEKCKVDGGSTLYVYAPNTVRLFFYAENGSYISTITAQNATVSVPQNARFFNFHMSGSTYDNNICISYSDDKNGTYTKYVPSNAELQAEVELEDISSKLTSTYFDFKAYRQGKIIVLFLKYTKQEIPTTRVPLVTGFDRGAKTDSEFEYKMTPNGTVLGALMKNKAFEGRANGSAIPAMTYLYAKFVLVTE